MAIRNYTSSIDPAKTAGEIQRLLAENNARRISIDYESGKAKAVEFMMEVEGVPMWFRVEPDPAGMLAALKQDKGVPPRHRTRSQAERTAWKNKYDWLDAQLAEVAAGQARLDQLLLGFAVRPDGRTVYEAIQSDPHGLLRATNRRALPSGDGVPDVEYEIVDGD